MKPLKIGVSGIYGRPGETLTPELITNFSAAFGTFIDSGKILVGYDTRPSGTMISNAIISGLISTGCDVVNLKITSTAALQYGIKALDADGGVMISAGTGEQNWNAMKFFRDDGYFLNSFQIKELLDLYNQGEYKKADWQNIGQISETTLSTRHIDHILNKVDKEKISERNFSIAVDCGPGAGQITVPKFLNKLNCNIFLLENDLNNFNNYSVDKLSSVMKIKSFDLGVKVDNDVDRVVFFDENGVCLGDENTLVLLGDYILSRYPKTPVITNLSTTQKIDIIAAKHGCEVERTKTGQAYIMELMKNSNSKFGGEGNGGVIVPDIMNAQDSLVSIGLILEYLAVSGKKMSDLSREIPVFWMVKNKIPCTISKSYHILKELRRVYKGEEINTMDGVKIFFNEKTWVHIRPSATEMFLRIIGESDDKDFIINKISDLEKYINKL